MATSLTPYYHSLKYIQMFTQQHAMSPSIYCKILKFTHHHSTQPTITQVYSYAHTIARSITQISEKVDSIPLNITPDHSIILQSIESYCVMLCQRWRVAFTAVWWCVMLRQHGWGSHIITRYHTLRDNTNQLTLHHSFPHITTPVCWVQH